MKNTIIFDLDGTLVNTSALQPLRDQRDWRGCVNNLHDTKSYEGIPQLLAELKSKKYQIAIVTSSVSFYANAVLSHHKLPFDLLIAYHDVTDHKPHAEPILTACNKLEVDPRTVYAVGDAEIDAHSAARAGAIPAGAAWSNVFCPSPLWKIELETPGDLLYLIETP